MIKLLFTLIMFVDCNGGETFHTMPTTITITNTEVCVNKICDKITSIEEKTFHKLYKTDKDYIFYKIRDTEVVRYNGCEVAFYTNQ